MLLRTSIRIYKTATWHSNMFDNKHWLDFYISVKGSIVSCQLSRTNINDFLLIVSETFKKHLCIYNCLVNILYESLWYVIIFHAYLHRKFSRATIIYSVSRHRNEKPRKKKNEMYETSFYFSMRKRNYLPKKLFLNKTCVQNEYT